MKLLEHKPMKQLEYKPMAYQSGKVALRLGDFNRMLAAAISRNDPNVDLLITGFRYSDTKAELQD